MAHTGDPDTLPPTQYLILDVMAARYRLGEPFWTFPDRLRSAAEKLAQTGLVWTNSSPAPNSFQVWFTEAGKAAAVSPSYTPPLPTLPAGTTTTEEWSVRWTWPDGATDEMDCPPAQGRARPAQERARFQAAAHTAKGITGEVLRRRVHTTPAEVVETYPAQPDPPTSEGATPDA